MGVACKLSCGHCSYHQNVFLGIGFRYIDLDSILEWYEEEEGRQRIKEFRGDQKTTFHCYDGLYVCPECNYLLNHVYLHMQSETKSYTNRYICPRCNTKMPTEPLLEEIKSGVLDCPDCKQEKLVVAFYMDWD
ncbi:hypothetical protein [Paenibacillus motobuensis]|uniref:Uncharacterized protein n=1 Tax=Paenibacillus motobuensis TaxID=295324 RepID=A0ABN0Y6Z9_9BACL